MFKNLFNSKEEEYQSWYDLSYKDSYNLEQEFIKNDMGKSEKTAMHICVIVGIISLVLGMSFIMGFYMMQKLNLYNFVILLLLTILGIILIVWSTDSYQKKFNSWLKIKHKIIKR